MALESLDSEIKWLESRLEAKKKELEDSSGAEKHEREIVAEILKETARNMPPPISPPPLKPLSDDAAKQIAYDLEEKGHEEVIRDLIVLALSKGLVAALKVANSLKNPHLLDEFHDNLADKYYEKLLETRKIR